MSAQTIFEQLRKAGMTVTGALSLMGNWQCESNNESCRLQGDFTSDRSKSKNYADRVDNGLISEEEFCRDGLGWGLAQWTYHSRKRELYNFCRHRSISIANEQAQVDFSVNELKTSFPAVWQMLITATESELPAAVEMVCRRYEAPAFNNISCRVNAANELKKQLNLGGEEEKPKQPEDSTEIFWPPRMLCIEMRGPDVSVLQALLLAHGYNCGGITGVFDNRTKNMVLAYQSENGLDVDGIAGRKTFRALGVTV